VILTHTPGGNQLLMSAGARPLLPAPGRQQPVELFQKAFSQLTDSLLYGRWPPAGLISFTSGLER